MGWGQPTVSWGCQAEGQGWGQVVTLASAPQSRLSSGGDPADSSARLQMLCLLHFMKPPTPTPPSHCCAVWAGGGLWGGQGVP